MADEFSRHATFVLQMLIQMTFAFIFSTTVPRTHPKVGKIFKFTCKERNSGAFSILKFFKYLQSLN